MAGRNPTNGVFLKDSFSFIPQHPGTKCKENKVYEQT